MITLDKNKFVNSEIERYIISGILRTPELYFDLEPVIKSDDFSERIHQNVWSIFGDLIRNNKTLDYQTVAFKIQELKISYNLSLSVDNYLESVWNMNISPDGATLHAKELKKLVGRREIALAALDVANKMIEAKSNLTYSEIVTLADTTFNSKINMFEVGGSAEPVDVFAGLEAEIENASNEKSSNEIICPFPRMKKLYGDFISGEAYFFCARPKSSKSTFLMNLALQCSTNIEENVQVLYLDTELSTDKVKLRLLSAISNVNEYFIRTKRWRENPEMVKAIRAAWPKVKLYLNLISHLYIANMEISEVLSVIRRWAKRADPKARKILVFDYLKLGNEFHQSSSNMRPDLVLGRKTDLLKKISEELGLVCLSAAQNNRSGEVARTGNALERRDDGAVIGQSDQIAQFASQIYILGKLTASENMELLDGYGVKNATHFCKSIYSRNLGEEACMGFNDLIKVQVGDKVEWRENVLYYNITNFLCTEITDLATLVKDRKNYSLAGSSDGEDGELL